MNKNNSKKKIQKSLNYIATWRILIQVRYQMAIKENTKNFSNWKPTLIKSFKYKFYNDY